METYCDPQHPLCWQTFLQRLFSLKRTHTLFWTASKTGVRGQRWTHRQCEHEARLKLPFSCLPVQTVPSLLLAIRSLWRTELKLGAAICRPGVMHMAQPALFGGVLIQQSWTWIDLWRSWTRSPRASYRCLIPFWLTFCWQQCPLKPLFSLYQHAKSCLSFLLMPWHSFRKKEGQKDPLLPH